MNLPEGEPAAHLPAHLALEDKWILSKYNRLVADVTENLEKFELGLAVAKLYEFTWDVFCDWYIEVAKVGLNSGDGEKAAATRAVLVYVLDGILKLLHPFMPFITEEIWQSLPHEGESIMVSAWPVCSDALCFAAEEAEFERIMAAVRAIRNRRAEMNVPPSKKAKVCIATQYADTFASGAVFMQRLAFASEVEVGAEFDMPGALTVVTADVRIYIPMNELVDIEAERARLQKQLAAAKKELEFVRAKLSNENFVSKAPAAVVDAQRAQEAKTVEKLSMLEESLAALG